MSLLFKISKFVFFVMIVLPATSLAGEAQAGKGKEYLDHFLTQSKTMSADFMQTLRSDDNEVLQESKGHFYLSRPGRFRWNYDQPYEQQIVCDGENVWVYDVDLQQVTVQKQAVSVKNTPMALMQGKLKLEQAYNVSELDHRDGVYRLKLSSKVDDVDFAELVVGVDKQGLRFMQLRDQFEQTTDIVFGDLELNKTLSDDLFEFTPPEGVDVFGGS